MEECKLQSAEALVLPATRGAAELLPMTLRPLPILFSLPVLPQSLCPNAALLISLRFYALLYHYYSERALSNRQ